MGASNLDGESQDISVHFVHPTEVGKQLQATVSPKATPRYLIEQLILSGFLEKASAATQYRLVNPATGYQLIDNIALADAQVLDESYLQVIHSVTGARKAQVKV
jgi:hypothetical protein